MTLAREKSVQKLELKSMHQMFGRTTREKVNKMHGAIAAVYAEAKTSHESFPLGSKFGFSAAILKKENYIALHNTVATGLSANDNLKTTWSFVHPSRPDTYDDTILQVHTDVSWRKKEAQRAELITQYKTFEGYEESYKEKIFLSCDKAYLVTIKTSCLGLPTNLLPKWSSISSNNASP